MYLKNSRSLSEVQLARAAISDVGDSYDDVGRGKIARDVVAKMSSLYPYLKRGTEMCLMLSTWLAEIRCHDNLLFRADDFSHHPGMRAQVLTESCSYQNLAEARAKCLGRAVELFVRGGESYKDICSSKTSWPDEEKCYKAVIDRFIR
ncbi:MAG: hypothetical protein OM95_11050 [Bdellovibrio sp. ArHS]|nr:MAG: hypothetical protein OM95_11050 [Bdellovibrio sp. ArHS]